MAVRAHPRVAAVLRAYARLGVAAVGRAPRRFRGTPARGEVLLWPAEARASHAVTRLRGARLFYAGSEAAAPDAAARLRVERAFPLADHGDLPSLIAHARAAGAKEVYLTRGCDDEVARAFARAGLRARPLGPPEQMTLFSSAPPRPRLPTRRPPRRRPPTTRSPAGRARAPR
jgi:hypothetical protein